VARRTLIRGATCVLPDETVRANVVVEGDRIAGVDVPGSVRADETIEADGLLLIPGVIDSHVHMREPGLTHKEDLRTGTMAAARGGVTTIFEMPNTKPATTSVALLHEKLELAASKCLVNYGFYIAATAGNLVELQSAERTPGIKIFIGSSTGDLLVDGQDDLERIFAETTLPICAHCEDEATVRANAAAINGGTTYADHSRIRNEEAAVVCVRRAMDLARRHGHRFHVLHVSTGAECELLRDHGGVVTGEACPHHLLFTTDDYERLGSRIQMNPGVKAPGNPEALWNALRDGVLQMIVTDHAPHTLEEKAAPYPQSPSGLPAVENSLALMLDQAHRGRCTVAPALVWDAVGKGRIEEGYDADLVLVDLEQERTILDHTQVSKCAWSPWNGRAVRGWPVRTIVMGRTVYADGGFDETARGREVRFDHGRGGYRAASRS